MMLELFGHAHKYEGVLHEAKGALDEAQDINTRYYFRV